MNLVIRTLWPLILLIAGTHQAHASSFPPSLSPLLRLNCAEPSLWSYWHSPNAQTDPFIVVYSIQGLWADLKQRLPPEIHALMVQSSRTALEEVPLSWAARDMDAVSDRFYQELQSGLARMEGIGRGPSYCQLDSAHLREIFKERYRFLMIGSEMDAWYREVKVDELNVKDFQFIALIAKGTTIAGQCREVFSSGRRRLIACE